MNGNWHFGWLARISVLGCVLAVVVSVGMWWAAAASGMRITAYFDRAVGLYPETSVRVLGIEVGEVERVRPQGEVVRVDFNVSEAVAVPAAAKAVVVSPSLVSDRYIQLTPASSDGPNMASGDEIPRDRTMTPLEMDDLYRNVNSLAEALGPKGANQDGALSDVLRTAEANLSGNGADINTTLQLLEELSGTLADSRGDFFRSVNNLNEFTRTLAVNDEQVAQLYQRMSDVTGSLAADREQLGSSLNSLGGTLGEVETFVRENREKLAGNVENMTGVTQALVDERESLAEVLDVAPTAASNFINAYDAASGSTAVRGVFTAPVMMACKTMRQQEQHPTPPELQNACGQLQPYLDGSVDPPPKVQKSLQQLQQKAAPPVPLTGSGSPGESDASSSAGG